MEYVSKSLSDTFSKATSFMQELQKLEHKGGASVVCLKGELGSGKTAFVKGVAEYMGVSNVVTSPTFVIEKIYLLPEPKQKELSLPFKRLIHIDAYRLRTGEDLEALGWDDIVADEENLIFIEWPEHVKSILPEDMKRIQFEYVDEEARMISY